MHCTVRTTKIKQLLISSDGAEKKNVTQSDNFTIRTDNLDKY